VVAADGTNTAAQLTSYVNPTFTSSRVLAFGPGIPSTQTITVAGDRTACLHYEQHPAR
jgi:hypothetical protein